MALDQFINPPDPATADAGELWRCKVAFVESNHKIERHLSKLYDSLRNMASSGKLAEAKLGKARKKVDKLREQGASPESLAELENDLVSIQNRIDDKARIEREVKDAIAEAEARLRFQKDWLTKVEHIHYGP